MPLPGDSDGPAIVGFGEHIFSNLGSLGAFTAVSEQVFAGITQRTMTHPLRSRYHCGYPDMLDLGACWTVARGPRRPALVPLLDLVRKYLVRGCVVRMLTQIHNAFT